MKLHETILRSLCRGAALFGLAALTLALPQGDPVDPQVEAARAIYQPRTWPVTERFAGYDLSRLTVPGHAGEAVQGSEGLVFRRFLALETELPAFHVELHVRDRVEESKEDLLHWVASVSAKKIVPRGESLGMAVGDISFVGPSQRADDRPLWIAFVRGNLSVRLTAQDLRRPQAPDLVGIARRIDRQIRARRKLAAGEALSKPVIGIFAAEASECAVGEATGLQLQVQDPGEGVFVPRFVLGGPGVGYVEKRDGEWKLFTTGAGKMTVTVEVMGSNGTFAASSFELLVRGD